MLPLVTIGIPNYNYSHYIVNALNSVANQTYPNIELIIIDDFSTDNSIKVIEGWINQYNGPIHINFIRNKKNLGLSKVCNQILNASNGKYFQPLDADDQILPDKIERQVKILEPLDGFAFVYSNIAVIDQNGKEIYNDYLKKIGYDKNNMPQGNIFRNVFEFNFIPLPSVLINSNIAKEVGGFDETLQVQDYCLWLKLSEKYNVVFDNSITALYREHHRSMSSSPFTNPNYVESLINLKLSYFKKSDEQIKSLIKKNVEDSSIYLYTMNYPNSKKWLALNLQLNPGIKSFIYWVTSRFSIPYSSVQNLKTLFFFKS